MFSQNLEERVILNYFGDFKGTLLDAGANDGVTFSNSRQLMLNGWTGHLFEPSSVFAELSVLYGKSVDAHVYNFGLGANKNIGVSFFESGAHVANGEDRGLVSSFNKNELSRWGNVSFSEKKSDILAFEDWHSMQRYTDIDFITIDIEGMDWELLQAIDLTAVGCKCLCIEWNSNKALGEQFKSYCTVKHGMKLLHTNAENMIFVK